MGARPPGRRPRGPGALITRGGLAVKSRRDGPGRESCGPGSGEILAGRDRLRRAAAGPEQGVGRARLFRRCDTRRDSQSTRPPSEYGPDHAGFEQTHRLRTLTRPPGADPGTTGNPPPELGDIGGKPREPERAGWGPPRTPARAPREGFRPEGARPGAVCRGSTPLRSVVCCVTEPKPDPGASRGHTQTCRSVQRTPASVATYKSAHCVPLWLSRVSNHSSSACAPPP